MERVDQHNPLHFIFLNDDSATPARCPPICNPSSAIFPVSQKRVILVEGPQREQGILKGRLQTQAPEIDGSVFLTGEYPVIPALQSGVKGYNIKEAPYRKAPPFRAESFHEKARPGDWVEARITQALAYDLVAQIEKILS